MRSFQPMPGNAWPHGMVITVTDDPDSLMELLWVRAAWQLQPSGPDEPPSLAVLPEIAPSAESLRRNKREWEQAWSELWAAAVEHLAKPPDPDAFEALIATGDGSAERRDLLTALRGPCWRTGTGDKPFDDTYQRWRRTLTDETIARHQRPLEDDPERRCLDPLVGAWRRGLTTVIAIPCSGTHTRTIGGHALLVARATRNNPERYAEALEHFPTR